MATDATRLIDVEQTAMSLAALRNAKTLVTESCKHAKGNADVGVVEAIRALAKSFDVVDEALRVELLRRRDLAQNSK